MCCSREIRYPLYVSLLSPVLSNSFVCNIWNSQNTGREDYRLLGSDVMWSARSIPTFHKSLVIGQSDRLKFKYSSVIRVDEFIYTDDGARRIFWNIATLLTDYTTSHPRTHLPWWWRKEDPLKFQYPPTGLRGLNIPGESFLNWFRMNRPNYLKTYFSV